MAAAHTLAAFDLPPSLLNFVPHMPIVNITPVGAVPTQATGAVTASSAVAPHAVVGPTAASVAAGNSAASPNVVVPLTPTNVVTVNSVASLNAALSNAHAGETIQLAPGQYD